MKDSDVNGKKVTKDEIRTIESAVMTIGGGELYSFFKISNYSNNDDITKAFNEFKKINNEDSVSSIEICYKVLSDSRLRSIYDSNFYNDLIQQQKKNINHHLNKQKNHIEIIKSDKNIEFVLLKAISIPLYTLSTILNANVSNNNGGFNFLINSHKELVKLIWKESGIIGFYRGAIFKLISYPFQKVLVNNQLSQLLDQFFYNNSYIKPFIYKSISEFPSTLFSDYITLSFSVTLVEQIKSLFLNGKLISIHYGSGSGNGSISIKKLVYSIGSSIILLSTRRLVLNLIKNIETKLIEGRKENPNSSLWEYGEIIYCNPIIKCLLTTLLVNPLEVLRLQSTFSYLKYSNTLNFLNPIQMIINLIKNQNSKNYFNGAPSLYLYLLISNFLKKFNNNNNNNNNDIHSLM
ncbi:hypothetical protein RB653_009341 [Dictyostelium firmibasis]|uniref:J domain-containing protein n=1 Tax=Dictyostelium firmibasis TaxID=79012 RepID=A0AAN7U1V8_9MYCE